MGYGTGGDPKWSVDKSSVYVGESVTFTVNYNNSSVRTLYIRLNGNIVKECDTDPCIYTYNFTQAGTYTFTLDYPNTSQTSYNNVSSVTVTVTDPPQFSTLTINNKEVSSLTINNKEVESIVRVSDGCVLYDKQIPSIIITSVSLTEANNKTVISASTSETAVFTATALDSNNNPVSGVSMVIKVNGTAVKTEATDSNGQVSYTYTAVGTGDVSISAECMSVIETYSIEDCYEIIPSPNSKGFSSQWYQSPVKITGEMIRKGSWGGTRIYGSSNATSVDRNYIFLSQNSGNAYESEKIRYNVPSSWFNFEVHVGNGSASLYVNNSLLNTVQVDTSGYVMISGGSNANPITMRNVKIKPL